MTVASIKLWTVWNEKNLAVFHLIQVINSIFYYTLYAFLYDIENKIMINTLWIITSDPAGINLIYFIIKIIFMSVK